MLHSFGSKANALVLRTLNDAASPVANVNDCGVAEAGSRSAAAPIWDPSTSIKLTPGKPATVHEGPSLRRDTSIMVEPAAPWTCSMVPTRLWAAHGATAAAAAGVLDEDEGDAVTAASATEEASADPSLEEHAESVSTAARAAVVAAHSVNGVCTRLLRARAGAGVLDVVLMRFSLLVCRLLPPILTRMGEATATN